MRIVNVSVTKNTHYTVGFAQNLPCDKPVDEFAEIPQTAYSNSLLYEPLYRQLQRDFEVLKLSQIDYKQQAHFWQAKHGESRRREEKLKKEINHLKAELKKAQHKIFGKSSEKNKNKAEGKGATTDTQQKKRKRGQQSNNKGPSRRDYSHLPSVIEDIDLAENEKYCRQCGLPHEKLPGAEESEIVELVDVKAHVRKIRRAMYKRNQSCHCVKQPKIITATPAPRLIPKTRYGVSIWAKILLEKFCYQRPTHRLLTFLTHQGVDLAPGTITDGLQKILPLLFPIYHAFQQQSLTEKHWHADETRWEVYEDIAGKAGSRWYLWIFKSEQVVILKVSPSRSAKTPGDYFKGVKEGILSVDRYSVYKAIAKNGVLILAFCWAHVRRDFLDYAKGFPEHEAWAFDWVDDIATLYHINNQRIAAPEKSQAFKKLHNALKQAVNGMQKKYRAQLQDDSLPKAALKILTSLDNHWKGLTVFIEYSFVPMDNNTAENGLRPGVLARNAFFGSQAVWSAYLLVIMLSIHQTLALWGINPHAWIYRYLHACAENGGESPENLKPFLPWEMTQQRCKLLQQPIPYDDTS